MSAFPKRGGALIFMTNLEIIKKLQQKIKEKPHEYQVLEDLFEMLRIYEKENHELAHIWNKDVTEKRIG